MQDLGDQAGAAGEEGALRNADKLQHLCDFLGNDSSQDASPFHEEVRGHSCRHHHRHQSSS